MWIPMEPLEEQRIIEFSSTLSNPVHISFHPSGQEKDGPFGTFCRDLNRITPMIEVRTATSDPRERPGFHIPPHLTLRYIPQGRELAPFLELLAVLDGMPPGVPEEDRQLVSRIQNPVYLKLYIGSHCPHCPAAVGWLAPLALDNPFIRLTITDAEMFMKDAYNDGIRSVPTLIFDEHMRWTGTMDRQDILGFIINQDPSQMSASSLRNLLEGGEAQRVSRMMLDSQSIYPAFIKLLVHEKWPVRLGAMVAMEAVMEENEELAARVVDPLWHEFHSASDAVRGDILHILGETGGPDTAKKIRTALKNPYPDDVEEAATEALEKIEVRTKKNRLPGKT